MASNKQELIQLHQLLADVRLYCEEHTDLPTSVDDFDAYSDIGITSLDLDASIERQKDAVLALGSGLATALSHPDPPSAHTTSTPKTASGPTEQTTLIDVMSGEAETVMADATGQSPAGHQSETAIAAEGPYDNQDVAGSVSTTASLAEPESDREENDVEDVGEVVSPEEVNRGTDPDPKSAAGTSNGEEQTEQVKLPT